MYSSWVPTISGDWDLFAFLAMATAPSGSEMASLISQLELITSNLPKDEETRQKLYDVTHTLNLALESFEDTLQRLVHLVSDQIRFTSTSMILALCWYLLLIERLLNLRLPALRTSSMCSTFSSDVVMRGQLLKSSWNRQELTMYYWVCVSWNTSILPTGTHSLYRSTYEVPCVGGHGQRDCARHLRTFEYNKKSYSSRIDGQYWIFVSWCFSSLAVNSWRITDIRFQIFMPCSQQLPNFLASTGYQNPCDSARSPFQSAFHTEKLQFDWLMGVPDYLKNFIMWMTVQHEGHAVWLDVFPLEEELCHDAGPQTPLFVDVGGSGGHQCVLLKTRCPGITGRIILQDQAPVIDQTPPIEGVEKMAHDFWTVQPVKGECLLLNWEYVVLNFLFRCESLLYAQYSPRLSRREMYYDLTPNHACDDWRLYHLDRRDGHAGQRSALACHELGHRNDGDPRITGKNRGSLASFTGQRWVENHEHPHIQCQSREKRYCG